MSNNFKYKLFGRFKGRKKNSLKNYNEINNYLVNLKKDIISSNYNILDIGSGSGENAISLSTRYPYSKITTCELYEDGNFNLTQSIVDKKIKNIKLFQGNVIEFLDNINNFEIFDEIWILFPDPWPKKRHHKRRLLKKDFLNRIYLYLKKQGKLMIASDSSSYLSHMCNLIYENQHLYLWNNQRYELWSYENLNLPKTKFYKKAIKSNRNSMLFELNKI